jgi:hypothetical protein
VFGVADVFLKYPGGFTATTATYECTLSVPMVEHVFCAGSLKKTQAFQIKATSMHQIHFTDMVE